MNSLNEKQLFHQHIISYAVAIGSLGGAHLTCDDHWVSWYIEGLSLQANGVTTDRDDPGLINKVEQLIFEIEATGATAAIRMLAGQAPRLMAKAQQLGFSNRFESTAMVVRDRELQTETVAGLSFHPVTRPKQWKTLYTILGSVFGMPMVEALDQLDFPEIARRNLVQIFLGELDGEVVSTVTLSILDNVASITNVGTPAEYRGNGYAGAMVTHAAEVAFHHGVKLVGLRAAPQALSLYKRLGFRQVSTYLTLSRPPENSSCQ